MRPVVSSLCVLLVLAGCSDAAVTSSGGAVVERSDEPWVILLQQSADRTQERIVTRELGIEPGEDVVLYGPEPSGALLLCPTPQASVLRGSPGAGYVMDAFFDDGEAFGFEPTSLGPHRVRHCPLWSAAGLGVTYTPESPVAWGSERTLVLDSRGDALRAVALELPDERGRSHLRIDEHRYAVAARDAAGPALRIVDIDDPEGRSVVHRHEGLDDGDYTFGLLEGSLIYATPGEPRELRAYDLDTAEDTSLTTLRAASDGVEMVQLDDLMVVNAHAYDSPVQDALVVRKAGDGFELTTLDRSAVPAEPWGISASWAAELVYRFETAERHGYAMVDPRTTDAPRVVARYALDEWLIGPAILEPLGLGGGLLMRDGTVPLRLVWFALDGSTPEMNTVDLDISDCDERRLPAMGSDGDATFLFFCDRDGVPHTAQWSPSAPEERPQWEADVRRVETTEGDLVLSHTFELSDKLIGIDAESPERAQMLIDLPSGRARTLNLGSSGWTTSGVVFPDFAE